MRLVASFVVVFVLLQALSRTLLLIRYQLNKKYYAEVLCSNKGIVVIDCEGQCRLLKEVEDEERRSMTIPGFEKTEISTLPPSPEIMATRGNKDEYFLAAYQAAARNGWRTVPYKPPRLPAFG